MTKDNPTRVTASARSVSDYRRLASLAFILSGISFLVGGAIVIRTEVPPSLSPVLGVLSHALWALSMATLALGAVAVRRSVDTLRTGLAGDLATGVFGLGVLTGLQWVTWAYVDVRAAREDEHEVVLETLIVPFGAGHLIMYGILLGTGIAFLGWALSRTELTHHYVGWIGVILGALTVTLWGISLLFAFGGGDDGHILFDIATILLPVLYLWAMILGVDSYRRENISSD